MVGIDILGLCVGLAAVLVGVAWGALMEER